MRQIPSKANFKPIVAKTGLFSITARNYYSQNSFYLSENFKREVADKLDPIAQEFFNHEALRHPLFDYLKEQSQKGFTAKQFLVYRDNFFRRSQLEVGYTAETIRAAMLDGDSNGAALTFRNLNNKMARGDTEKMHSQLLLESHNIHGMKVFGLDPIAKITDVETSKVLLPEVEKYRRSKEEFFTKPYPYIAGNTWAHELAADSMLDNFRKAFFAPYENLYKPKEYAHVMAFFTAHKDESHEGGNVEQQHEEMARKTVESACFESLTHIPQVREGGLEFLHRQAGLWEELLIAVQKARHVGEIIKPKIRESGIIIEEIDESKEQESINVKTPNASIKHAAVEKTAFYSNKESNVR
jgi:hypothetical protein